jgi:hypothetical protein
VIDGSSPEAFERTTEAARREIPDADRLAFDRALRTVGGRRHAERDPEPCARDIRWHDCAGRRRGCAGAQMRGEQG